MLIDELNKQWIPVSFISIIADTLSSYEKEEKKILIGKFNEKISQVVEEYQAPFIYEKIGEKYKHFFIDEQRLGPYKMWHHQHFFEEKDGGILMTDIITYIPPFGILGDIANTLLIKKQLKGIFDYRFKVMDEKLNR